MATAAPGRASVRSAAVQLQPGGSSNSFPACRFFQYMTFYMVALQLVQFSLAVMADALPLVSTPLHG